MARVVESSGTETARIVFELDQFELAGGDRLEVRGRWFGVRGRRFVRPTLMLKADGEPRRALADLEHKPWFAEDGEPWEASFPWGLPGAEVREAELTVAPDITIPLPAPNGRRPRPARIPAHSVGRPDTRAAARPDELTVARQEIERLRSEIDASNAARLASHGERDQARGERDEALAERDRVAAERDRIEADRDQLHAQLAAVQAERDEARAAVARARTERDEALDTYARLAGARDQALNERSAALAARDEAVRSRDEAVRLREQALDERDRTLADLGAQRVDAQRIHAEREAELNTRGAAMVMRGAHRAAPVPRDWTPRAIAIAVLVVALLALLVIVRPL